MTVARRFWAPLSLVVVLLALALDFWNRPEPIGIDFHTYLAAARVGLQYGWSHIYDQPLVAIAQRDLVATQDAQPFLSPPPVAWLAAVLSPLPYWAAYYIWATVTFVAFALALLWASREHGLVRWMTVGAALAPWWVLHAVHLGQVVPLVAAGAVVACRLLRDRHRWWADSALAVLLLKPNTVILVPFALLVAARYRTFLMLSALGAAVGLIAFVTMGPSGIDAYTARITGPLPPGANYLTLEGALGVSGPIPNGLRVLVVVVSLGAAYRLRQSPGLFIAVGVLGSLLFAPYLHASDLCLLSVAAWIVWEERPSLAWRVPLAAGWIAASPFVMLTGAGPSLDRWPLIELALLAGLAYEARRPGRATELPLTGEAELRTWAPA